MIHRTIYLSATHRPLAAADLAQIMDSSRRNNARDGITGLMVYHDCQVLQVLEGEGEPLRRVYARICADPRHGGIIRLWSGQVDGRAFGDWRMGLVRAADLGPEARAAVLPLIDLARGTAPLPDDRRLAALLAGFFRTLRGFEVLRAVEG